MNEKLQDILKQLPKDANICSYSWNTNEIYKVLYVPKENMIYLGDDFDELLLDIFSDEVEYVEELEFKNGKDYFIYSL